MPLTPDQTDAVLRDPNAPGDVRATVLADYSVSRYLDTVEFYEDDDGVTHTRPTSETVAQREANSADGPPEPTADPATAPPVDPAATPPADPDPANDNGA